MAGDINRVTLVGRLTGYPATPVSLEDVVGHEGQRTLIRELRRLLSRFCCGVGHGAGSCGGLRAVS